MPFLGFSFSLHKGVKECDISLLVFFNNLQEPEIGSRHPLAQEGLKFDLARAKINGLAPVELERQHV